MVDVTVQRVTCDPVVFMVVVGVRGAGVVPPALVPRARQPAQPVEQGGLAFHAPVHASVHAPHAVHGQGRGGRPRQLGAPLAAHRRVLAGPLADVPYLQAAATVGRHVLRGVAARDPQRQ